MILRRLKNSNKKEQSKKFNLIMKRDIHILKKVVSMTTMSVCMDPNVSDKEILRYCNNLNPSGTEKGWICVNRNKSIQCDVDPERIHLIIEC